MKRIFVCLIFCYSLSAHMFEQEIPEILKRPYITEKYPYSIPAVAATALVGMNIAPTFSSRILTFFGIMAAGMYGRQEYHKYILVRNGIPHQSGALFFNGKTYFTHCDDSCTHTKQHSAVKY